MSVSISAVTTDQAPAAIGPYSQALAAAGFLFVSGQIPLHPRTGEVVEGFANQVRQVLANLDAILQAAGTSRDKVVKVTVFLTDLGQFATFNQIYTEFFGSHRPARAVVQVSALPRGVQVEAEAIALLA